MAELNLWFYRSWSDGYELERTHFLGNPHKYEIRAVRGKTPGAYRDAGSFQWTSAVKAVSVIFLMALSRHLKRTTFTAPILEGSKHSLAASLNYALDKQPQWLFDMFGQDDDGNSYLRQLLMRTNSGRKRNAPVLFSLNETLLRPKSINIYVGGSLVNNPDTLDDLAETIVNEFEQELLVARAIIEKNNVNSSSSLSTECDINNTNMSHWSDHTITLKKWFRQYCEPHEAYNS